MDATSILREILGQNATDSGRIREMQRGGQGQADMGKTLEDLLGVRDDDELDHRTPQRRRAPVEDVRPSPRRRESVPAETTRRTPSRGGGGLLEDLLGGILGGKKQAPRPEPKVAPPQRREEDVQRQQQQAVFLIQAMCNAAKVDGSVDRQEQDAILGRLGKVTEDELNFVRRELSSPIDVNAFCHSVPDELAEQVYGFSVMAIKLDTLKEAAYLGRLAGGLGLDERRCEAIHSKMGAPSLYAS